MSRFTTPEERLSEFLGVRMTPEQKRITITMAEDEGITVGKLVRGLLKKRAAAKGIKEAPPKKRARRGPRTKRRR